MGLFTLLSPLMHNDLTLPWWWSLPPPKHLFTLGIVDEVEGREWGAETTLPLLLVLLKKTRTWKWALFRTRPTSSSDRAFATFLSLLFPFFMVCLDTIMVLVALNSFFSRLPWQQGRSTNPQHPHPKPCHAHPHPHCHPPHPTTHITITGWIVVIGWAFIMKEKANSCYHNLKNGGGRR